jgi:putative ABC transport system substrate-binding protein
MAELTNPANPNAGAISKERQAAAHSRGLEFHVLYASTEREVEGAFASLRQLRAGGLVIDPDPFFNARSELLGDLALRHAMPAIYQYPEFVAAGGLMSYGGSSTDNYRLVGVYTGRILDSWACSCKLEARISIHVASPRRREWPRDRRGCRP